MPIHDWTRVDAGIFHAFHVKWISELDKALNGELLPPGFYSLLEQHTSTTIPDLLTLHARTVTEKPLAVARTRRRTLAIRHVSEHRLVAILEIVSPANKDRPRSVADFTWKIVTTFAYGVHALVIDLFPPGLHHSAGMHGAIWQRLEKTEEPYDLQEDDPLTLASYVAAEPVDIYLEHPAVGASLPEMPLFLRPDRYINVPLETTYTGSVSQHASILARCFGTTHVERWLSWAKAADPEKQSINLSCQLLFFQGVVRTSYSLDYSLPYAGWHGKLQGFICDLRVQLVYADRESLCRLCG